MKKKAVIAGTGYEGRARVIRSYCREGRNITLKREPKNKYDTNAIAVYIHAPIMFGLLGKWKKQIGYIKASTAKNLARKMDGGEKLSASVISYYAPKHEKHPRVTIEIISNS